MDSRVYWNDDFHLWWPLTQNVEGARNAHRYIMKRITDVDLTVQRCKHTRVCVQAGGHIGLWPLRLAKTFDKVYTFEIDPNCYEALKNNCEGYSNVIHSPKGLGSGESVAMAEPHAVGSWRIGPEGTLKTEMTTIDSLKLKVCAAIILDVEGGEVEALKGASDTIKRCRPVIHVEELPRSKKAIREHLEGLGYKRVVEVHNDCIYV